MGFFGKLNPFHKKEKSPDFDIGGMGKDPFGPGMSSDFGSQNFPDAWNSGSQGLDSGMPGMGGGMGGLGGSSPAQPSFGSPQPFGQQSPFAQPAQPSFAQQPLSSQPAFQSSPSFSSPSSYAQPSYSAPQPAYGNDADYMHSKNLEVISSKIDALRAAIDSMNARLQNIERIAGQEEENRRKRYY